MLTASPEGFRRDADGRALDVRGAAWVQDNLDFYASVNSTKLLLKY